MRQGVGSPSAGVSTKPARLRRFFSFLVWWVGPGIVLALTLAYMGLAIDRQIYPPMVPVQGVSMLPLLSSGDLVLLKKADLKQLKRGDIIAFRTTSDVQQKWGVPGSYLHRIVTVQQGTNGKQFQTKGDNVTGMDPFWTIEQNVIGLYAGKLSGVGYPLVFFNSRQGKIFFGGGLLIIILYWLLGVFERRRAAVEVNVYNLASIVGEARRLAQRMEEISPAPPFDELGGSSVANPADLTASSELGSITPTQLPHLKRSFRGYSRKAVHKMYAQVMAEIDQSHRTVVAQLEQDKATIRQDQELLEEKLTHSIRRQKSLAIFHATTQEQHLSSNWP